MLSDAPASYALVGGHGFLGWHTAVRLRALHGSVPLLLGRDDTRSVETLAARIKGVDTVIHLAGVNRGESDQDVEQGNLVAARTLGNSIRLRGKPVHVVYANSIQADRDHGYGRGKAGARALLSDATASVGGTLVDVRLPNLFGEHGRPNYNSVVATFCHLVATGGDPQVNRNGKIPLMHAQDAAATMIAAANRRANGAESPKATLYQVGEILERIRRFHRIYATGQIPALQDKFDVDLFNTYRSFVFPSHFPIYPESHIDARGELVETVRTHGGPGMAFASTTRPGQRRGDHYHLNKIERFFVIAGVAEIAVRRLYDDNVIRFRLSGRKPGFVDMPTMWVHNITNVGDRDLLTIFWSNQLLNPEHPDQFLETVEPRNCAS